MPRSLGNPQSDPLSSSPVGGLGRRGGLSYAVDGRRRSVFFFFQIVAMETPGGSWLLPLLSLSYVSPDLHSHSWRSFIVFIWFYLSLVRNRTPEGALCPVCLYFIRFRMHKIAFQLPVVAPEESRATAKEQIREEEKSVSISFQSAPRADSSCSIYEYCTCKRQPAGPFE